MTSTTKWMTALVLAVLLLGACSSTDGGAADDLGSRGSVVEASDAPEREPERPGAGDAEGRRVDPREDGLELVFGEFAISLEADEIRPGPVTFVVRNGGALVHGFEIEAQDDDGDHSGSGKGGFKLEGPSLEPGEVVRIRADLAPGVYEIECFVDDHDDLGMRATLVVRPGAPLVRVERPSASQDSVEIAGFSFAPETMEVTTGTMVAWANVDEAPHTVTAEDGSFDSGTLEIRGSFSHRFVKVGTYPYVCRIHPTMRGTVRAVDP